MTEIAGLFVGLFVMASVVTVGFVTKGPQGMEDAYKSFCEQQLRGKWEPKAPPADSCPGGKWSNVITQPKK